MRSILKIASTILMPGSIMLAATSSLADEDATPAAQQIVRGNQTYEANCSMCHGQGFVGGPGVPGLTGASFQFGWKGKPAAELFTHIKTTMPPGQEGSLADAQVADVMAAILAANKAAVAGAQALPSDAATLADKTIRF